MRLDRIEREEEVLVDVINCIRRPDLNDTSLACRTVDVSENGMKVSTAMGIPVHTTLGLWLDIDTTIYRLEGMVRWAEDIGEHYVGLELKGDSPDFKRWTEMFQLDF